MAEAESETQYQRPRGLPMYCPRAASVLVMATALAVLIGYALDIDVLKRIGPRFVAMSPMTAASLLLCGLALLLLDQAGSRRWAIPLARAAALAVATLGALRLASYVGRVDLGLDRLLFPDRLLEPALRIPNRIAPNTAANMLLAGLGIALLSAPSSAKRLAGQLLALATALLSMLGLVGYLYNAYSFYGVGNYVPMALHSAAAFMLLSLGMLFLRPDCGFMQVVVSPGAGGVTARRLLPAAIFVPILLGCLELAARRGGLNTPEFLSALRVVLSVLFMLSLVWWTAARLYRLDSLRRAAESKLADAIDAADAANRAKSAFLANMSHEIRTPMSAIIGYTDLLTDPDQDPSERLNHVNVIRRNASHLLSIINDILDLSKIESGQLTTESIACSPCQIISEVTSIMRVRALERGLDMRVRIDAPVPRTIQSDPMRLRQILINLTGNAIKFTEAGSIQLTAGLLDPPDSPRPRLRFQVIDTGIGISDQEIGRLFQPFSQADASIARRFGGTGLGLAICKRLAKNLGGDISVQSSPGRGSCFALTIDAGVLAGVELIRDYAEVVHDSPQPAPADVRLSGRILLAEDGPDNRQLLSLYLNNAGAQVALAENGRLALEKATAAMNDGQPFDLILMDMRMPELDGYGATAKLRRRGYAGPIIALTAHAMADDRDKCLRCGCTDYLSKPVRKAELLELVRRHLSGRQAPAAARSNPPLTIPPANVDPEVREFIPRFIADLPPQVAQLIATLNRGDMEALEDVVHQLKGSGGVYGFDRITELAALAQKSIAAGATDEIARHVRELVDMIRRVEGYDPARERAEIAA